VMADEALLHVSVAAERYDPEQDTGPYEKVS